MHIEILYIDDCPNSAEAGVRVEAALRELGRGTDEVTYRLLESGDAAAEVPFAGSPTILIDGVDAVDQGERTTDLACRVYQTETGIAGAPSVTQLVYAIRAHLRPADRA